jgi:membrane protein
VTTEPSRPHAAFGVRTQLLTFFRLGPRQLARLLFDAYGEWSADGAARLGAALAYYALFSAAPVIIIVTSVVGLAFGRAAASGEVAPLLERFVGHEGARATELMLSYSSSRAQGTVAAVVGTISLLLAASTLVNELRQSLNIVWKIAPPPSAGAGLVATLRATFVDRLYAIAIVIGAGVLIVLSVLVNAAVSAMGKYASSWLPLPAWLLQGMNLTVGIGLMMVTFALLYKAVPDAKVSWGDAFVGGLLTALLFQVGTLLLSTFLGTVTGSVYGTAASVLAMLLWVYYSAQVFFFGAEAARLFADRFGGRIVPRH